MKIGVILAGKNVMTAELDLTYLAGAIATSQHAEIRVEALSTPATPDQMKGLLLAVGCGGDDVLKFIADHPDGITSISTAGNHLTHAKDEWFSNLNGFVQYATQEFRIIVCNPDAQLFQWVTCYDDADSSIFPECGVAIDGVALQSLRSAVRSHAYFTCYENDEGE